MPQGQAGAEEIEVAPAMLEAGIDALYLHEPEEVGPAKTVEEIFKAMRVRQMPR